MLWWKRLKKDDPEKREALREQIEEEGGLERFDFLAMVLSALGTLLPVAILVLLLLLLPVLLLFLL